MFLVQTRFKNSFKDVQLSNMKCVESLDGVEPRYWDCLNRFSFSSEEKAQELVDLFTVAGTEANLEGPYTYSDTKEPYWLVRVQVGVMKAIELIPDTNACTKSYMYVNGAWKLNLEARRELKALARSVDPNIIW